MKKNTFYLTFAMLVMFQSYAPVHAFDIGASFQKAKDFASTFWEKVKDDWQETVDEIDSTSPTEEPCDTDLEDDESAFEKAKDFASTFWEKVKDDWQETVDEVGSTTTEEPCDTDLEADESGYSNSGSKGSDVIRDSYETASKSKESYGNEDSYSTTTEPCDSVKID